MHRTGRSLVVAMAAVSVLGLVSGASRADTANLTPIKDATLYETDVGDLANGAGQHLFTGTSLGNPGTRRTVLAFDIAGNIPAGSTINSVELTMNVSRVRDATGRNTSLHRCQRNWQEGSAIATGNEGMGLPCTGTPNPCDGGATWNHTLYPGGVWVSPGGDYSAGARATTAVGSIGSYTWGSTPGMVSDVQVWLDTPAVNFGWVILGDESAPGTAKRLDSRESTTPPQLVVDFTPPGSTGGCCQGATCSVLSSADCLSAGGVYQGNGTSCSPNPCAEPFGACCASNGTCTEETQTSCEGGGGAFQGDGTSCAATDCPIELTPYVDPLPLPATAVPTSGASGGVAAYDMTIVEFEQQLHSELPPTTVWGYDDGFGGPAFPGPTIEARTNQQVTVDWINDLAYVGSGLPRTDHYLDVDQSCVHGAQDLAKSVTHLHGGHVDWLFDGYPEFTVLPGESDVYVYPNGQQASPLWYHDHALGITRLNVYMGLAGMYLIRDAVEDSINLPGGEFEVPLVLQDRKFNPDGSLRYPAVWQDHFFGDKFLVNGKVWPHLDVKRGKYRFRILNGSGSRTYTLSLNPPSGSLDFTVIGTDGGLLEQPVTGVAQLTLGPAERFDVIVDFESFNPGDEILLGNSAPAPFPNGSVDETRVMKFIVGTQFGDTDAVPANLRTIERLDPADSVATRDFLLKKATDDGCGRQNWLINNLAWDDITEYPELDTVEIWRFINDSGVSHPMHMHLVMFQILDRDTFTVGGGGEIIPDGTPQPPLPEEDGWKDTAMVGPGEIVRVIARFEDFKGKFAYHCHILEHEDHEMMRQFQTVRCGDTELDPTEACDDGNLSLTDGCSDTCDLEEFVQLDGLASGGGGESVDLTIAGELISVSTTPSQTAAQVVLALAAAINANANLQALGIVATAVGDRVVTNGDISTVQINDAGLADVLHLAMAPGGLWWSNVDGGSGYDVVRGDLIELRNSGGNFASVLVTESCLTDDTAGTYLQNGDTPAAGEAIWYVVRRQPGGTYDSGFPSQIGSRDFEIIGSGNGCP